MILFVYQQKSTVSPVTVMILSMQQVELFLSACTRLLGLLFKVETVSLLALMWVILF